VRNARVQDVCDLGIASMPSLVTRKDPTAAAESQHYSDSD
jgi:hypothetical protein